MFDKRWIWASQISLRFVILPNLCRARQKFSKLMLRNKFLILGEFVQNLVTLMQWPYLGRVTWFDIICKLVYVPWCYPFLFARWYTTRYEPSKYLGGVVNRMPVMQLGNICSHGVAGLSINKDQSLNCTISS